MFKKILVGVDGSDESLKAVREAAQLAKLTEGQTTLVYVMTPIYPTIGIPGIGVATIDSSVLEEQSWRIGQDILDQAERVYTEEGAPAPERMALQGRPGNAIVRYAAEINTEVIVVGSAGSGIEDLILGSTADAVIHHAPCPVLVVR